MLTPLLAAIALLLADAPVATPAPTPPAAAAPAAPAAPAPVDPVVAEINALLTPHKDKSGDTLRGKLGFSVGRRAARDGEVVFWDANLEQPTTCGMDMATGAMRCLRGEPISCRLAIAFDTAGLVKAWAVTGAPGVCRGFVTLLKAP